MKRIFIFIIVFTVFAGVSSGCGGIDKRLYGEWADDSGAYGYGFGMDGAGYTMYQSFTLPIRFGMKDRKVYVLLKEEGDPFTNEETLIYGITFFGDNEFALEYPVDSGEATIYKRKASQG